MATLDSFFTSLQLLDDESRMQFYKANSRQVNARVIYELPSDVRPPRVGRKVKGREVYLSNIPRTMKLEEICPLLDWVGNIMEFRLMITFSGANRGFGYVTFDSPEVASRAIQCLNGLQLRPGKHLVAAASVDNCRLFIGNIPKNVRKETIVNVFASVVSDIAEVIVYKSLENNADYNRGYCFLEFHSHKAAHLARRELFHNRQIFSQFYPAGSVSYNIYVNWAKPEATVDPDIMNRETTMGDLPLLDGMMAQLALGNPRTFSHDPFHFQYGSGSEYTDSERYPVGAYGTSSTSQRLSYFSNCGRATNLAIW